MISHCIRCSKIISPIRNGILCELCFAQREANRKGYEIAKLVSEASRKPSSFHESPEHRRDAEFLRKCFPQHPTHTLNRKSK